MRWYDSLREARKPPAYLVERISDLLFVSELSKTSPSGARSVLDGVLSQLEAHMDQEYTGDLEMASRILLDNPQKARNMIGLIVSFMQSDKETYDLEKEKPWLKNWPK